MTLLGIGQFTSQALAVITGAERMARSLGHTSTRPEHILWALAGAMPILQKYGVTHGEVRRRLLSPLTQGTAEVSTSGLVPLSEDAKTVVRRAADEANRHNHPHNRRNGNRHLISTEDLLLAIMKDSGLPAFWLVADHIGDYDTVCETLGIT